MSKATKHRPDLAPVPWLLLAFLLGVSAGLLLSMSQTAQAVDSSAERSELAARMDDRTGRRC